MNAKLTLESLSSMKLGGKPRFFRFDTAKEVDSARQNAYYIKRKHPRPDGAVYKIYASHRMRMVTVVLVKEENDNGTPE